ncbi:MAG TPA: hypothetical protein VK862_05850 [Afifellaceae bacterium]|nr:hypothetical protein [Afifellaceae bacterium]
MVTLDDHRRQVETGDGVSLSVIDIDSGSRRPFVILPVWTNAVIEYRPQIEDFARDHRVIAVDMRGHGERFLQNALRLVSPLL